MKKEKFFQDIFFIVYFGSFKSIKKNLNTVGVDFCYKIINRTYLQLPNDFFLLENAGIL